MQGWPPDTVVPGTHDSLNPNQFQHGDQLPQLVGQMPQLLFQCREQCALHHTKKLIQLAGEGKLRKVGVVALGLVC